MSFLLDILRSLGAGEQILVAAMLGIVVIYLFKGKAFAGVVIGAVGSATTIAIGALIVLAVAIGAGWLDPEPSVLFSHVAAAGELAQQFVFDRIKGVIGV